MALNAMPLDALAPKRGKGRPRHNAAETEAIRKRIWQAAGWVFSELGSRGVSVELITQACGISRPTFYRYFKNADEALESALKEANDSLIAVLVTAIGQGDGLLQKVEAGLQAWRSWGEQTGPMVRGIFAEMQDPHSPAYPHRQRVLQAIGLALNQTAVEQGRPPLNPLQIETFVIGVEYLGYRYLFGPEEPSEASWQRTRQTMLRLAIGLLGGAMEWRHSVQLADALGISLEGR